VIWTFKSIPETIIALFVFAGLFIVCIALMYGLTCLAKFISASVKEIMDDDKKFKL
jgi:hypothetical protein